MASFNGEPSIVPTQLDANTWQKVHNVQLKKAIAEFAHEQLLIPEETATPDTYVIYSDDGSIHYQFKAQLLMLDHWWIEEDSIIKRKGPQELPLDLLDFVVEFQVQLRLSNKGLPTYLEELTSTLSSQAYKAKYQRMAAEDLVGASFQQIEQAMLEGHPCFVANSGRIGFNSRDYEVYAPESAVPFNLIWLAGHRSNACFTAVDELSYQDLLTQELSVTMVEQFNTVLEELNKDPSDYIFLPVHPWQWFNKLTLVFAADIATHNLIYLGHSKDQYVAQQSIRTLYNKDAPKKFYTKTALSIINMGFMRGLSPHYMRSTPAITEWINALLTTDAYLETCGFQMLGEVATVGYTNNYYNSLGKSCAYNKMLSALWRESPMQKKKANQNVMTMAAFLHVDHKGNALLPAIIKASGLTTGGWIAAYLKCYLAPLIHCFFKHELVFMPHGENVIMILENNIPVGVFMKDITEEILLYNQTSTLPKEVQRVRVDTTDELKVLSLFTDVFDCYFRFMSAILQQHADFSQELFWQLVAKCIYDYQQEHPALATQYERFDLFVPTFKKCCLNRLQLSNNKQMLDLADPINSLQFAGVLDNPIACYKEAFLLEIT